MENEIVRSDGKQLKRVSSVELSEIIMHLASGDATEPQIKKQYGITATQLRTLKENYRTSIAELANKLALERAEFLKKMIEVKRLEIAESITKKDIQKASLTGKTRSLVDLTQVARLEQGKSTQNIDISTSQMSKEQAIKFILGEDIVEEPK